MLIDFMITRLSRAFPLAAAAAASLSIFAAGCQKVPLLAPSGSTITLTVAATALPVNGTAQLIAQVIEASGTPPHSGTEVTFTTSLGTIEPSTASTDASGRAVVTFKAGNSNGTATITAISGGASVSGNNAVKIAIGTAAVGHVNVSASPATIPAIGGSSTIIANIVDINGNPLTNALVNFSTTAGSLSSTAVNTDQNGVAQTQLTTGLQATVTASVGGQGSTGTGTGTGTGAGTGTTTPPANTSGQASGTVTVNVSAAPVVSIVLASTSTTPTAGTDTAFTGSVAAAATNGAAIQDVTVNYDDGTIKDLGPANGTAIGLHHVYTSGGTFTVTLSARDSNGSTGTGVTSVFVQAQTPLTVLLSATATPNGPNTTESFTATVVGLGNAVVVNYHWVFGGTNGSVDSTSNQQARSYVAGSGPIVVSVTITTSTGLTATGSTVITP